VTIGGAVGRVFAIVALSACTFAGGCVSTHPATDTGDTLTPTAPSLPSPQQPLAYEPDMRQLFASDCVYCHGGYRIDGEYRMRTYEEVSTSLRPGVTTGGLIETTRTNGSMYPYFTGNEQTRRRKSEMVFQWIVTYRAQRVR
jgi:hypothetical protein